MAKRIKFTTFTATADQAVYVKDGKVYIQGMNRGRPPADLSTWTKCQDATKLAQSDKLVAQSAITNTALREAGFKVRGRPLGSKNKAKDASAV